MIYISPPFPRGYAHPQFQTGLLRPMMRSVPTPVFLHYAKGNVVNSFLVVANRKGSDNQRRPHVVDIFVLVVYNENVHSYYTRKSAECQVLAVRSLV